MRRLFLECCRFVSVVVLLIDFIVCSARVVFVPACVLFLLDIKHFCYGIEHNNIYFFVEMPMMIYDELNTSLSKFIMHCDCLALPRALAL
jgi:hypothetical protein